MDNIRTKTKIVATLGPTTHTKDIIKELVLSGVTMFRINTSHGKKEEHKEKIDYIREIEKELNINIPVLIDLQGPKIRVGELKAPIEIRKGEEIVLEHTTNEENGIIPVDYEGIAKDAAVGEKILLDDGKIGLVVKKIENNKVYTEVLYGEVIKPRKGINLPGAQASLEAVTARDKEYIKFAVEEKADYIALSFVRKAEDIKCAKYYTKAYGENEIPIIAKIEKPQALDNLEEIIIESDAIMVARGDLGIEMSPQEVPIAQKKIIELSNKHKKPCIVATQMLESMIEEPIPTRAEASDVANAIYDGADAIMLSAETASGKYPIEAVKMMNIIAQTVEESSYLKTDLDIELIRELNPISQAISNSSVQIAKNMDAEGILIFSENGYTPRIISKLKPSVPIIVITPSIITARQLNLYWGVFTYVADEYNNILDEKLFKKIDEKLIEKAHFKEGDEIVIVNSSPKLMTGNVNTIRVHILGESI